MLSTRRRSRKPLPPSRSTKRTKTGRRDAASGQAERSTEVSERTDDPVRMYLREMGSVELPVSRGRNRHRQAQSRPAARPWIGGLCESPLTFQAIIIWRDELNEGKILLRDIIDLEATYSGPFARPAGEEEGGTEEVFVPEAAPKPVNGSAQ